MLQQHPIIRHGKYLLLSGLCLLLFAVMFLIRSRMERNHRQSQKIYQELACYQQAGQLLRQGSDILTDTSRSYVVTADLTNRDEYFEEAKVARHREKGLEMLDTLSGGLAVKKNLAIAMQYSQELMDLEYHAMRLAATEAELESPACPEEIMGYFLPDEEMELSAEERRLRAQRLLFGNQYEHYKTQIYLFIDRCFTQATTALADKFTQNIARQRRLYLFLGLDMLALLVCGLVLLSLLHAQRTRTNFLLRNLLDNMPLLFFVKNARTETYIDANAAFLQFAGLASMEELIGKTDYDIFDKHTAKSLSDNDAKTLLSRKPVTLQSTLMDAEGKQRRCRITEFVFEEAAGFRCVIGMAADVTASEEASANADALAKLLFCLQDDASEVLPSQLLEIIRDRADADYALLVRYDQQGRCLIEKDCSIDRRHAQLTGPVGCLTGDIPQILREIRNQQCYSFSEDDLANLQAACAKQGNGSTALPKCSTMVAFPIFVHHELWGNLTLCYDQAHKLNKYEREFGTECCEVLAVSVERRVNYRRLQEALKKAVGEKASIPANPR